jgi:hypothetical protein
MVTNGSHMVLQLSDERRQLRLQQLIRPSGACTEGCGEEMRHARRRKISRSSRSPYPGRLTWPHGLHMLLQLSDDRRQPRRQELDGRGKHMATWPTWTPHGVTAQQSAAAAAPEAAGQALHAQTAAASRSSVRGGGRSHEARSATPAPARACIRPKRRKSAERVRLGPRGTPLR